jgi:predicted trehalose synthase
VSAFGWIGDIGKILSLVQEINTNVGKLMTQQQDIDNAVTAITGLLTDVAAQVAQLGTDLAALQAALAGGTPVSTAALDSAVAQVQATQTALDSAVSSITSLTPPAAPTP